MPLITRIYCVFTLLILSTGLTACIPIHNIRQPGPGVEKPRVFTILTYNIRVGAGLFKFGRNPYLLKDEIHPDLNPIIAAIRSLDPDIIGLQEVLGEDQAASIAGALNMNYAYVSHGLDTYGTWWGVAVLSKFPIRGVSRQEISSGPGNARANLYATISVFGKECVFVVMHKDKDQTRGYALRKTMARIQKIGSPVVLLGDFNIRPEDSRHDILSARLEDTAYLAESKSARYAEKRGTYPGKHGQNWGKRIDYVLVDKGRFEVLNAGLMKEKYWSASDHIGYFAKVKLK
jgi:endonuclease/exonuclease/phosphatase family metal-dependent hydrolase